MKTKSQIIQELREIIGPAEGGMADADIPPYFRAMRDKLEKYRERQRQQWRIFGVPIGRDGD